MSTYAINRLLFRLGREPELLARFRADPEAVFGEFDLTEEERALIRAKDVMTLHKRGVLPNCLMKLGPAYGVSVQALFEAAATPTPAERAGGD